jgi:hypothetical protein
MLIIKANIKTMPLTKQIKTYQHNKANAAVLINNFNYLEVEHAMILTKVVLIFNDLLHTKIFNYVQSFVGVHSAS